MGSDLSSITSKLSLAGTWSPIGSANAQGSAVPIANVFYSLITLPNGHKGIVMNGWAYDGWDNKVFYPVKASVLEETSNGSMTLATDKWLGDPTTNGSGSALVADFNKDGKQDIFFAAHNESPLIAKSSTAYLTNTSGGFSKVTLTDHVEAHGASLSYVNGDPIVLTMSYDGEPNPHYQYVGGQFVETPIASDGRGNKTPQGYLMADVNGSASVVADFNGDGQPDIAIGDVSYGPGWRYVAGQVGAGVWKLSDIDNNTGAPETTLIPYFNGKPQYANITNYMGSGQTHTFRMWAEDFNNDGKPDILAATSLWPENLGMLQMFQNRSTTSEMSFADRTDVLNSAYDVNTQEIDYSMQLVDIDKSGINSLLCAGTLVWPAKFVNGVIDNSSQSNYILLNDGTGHLYVYMHGQFNELSVQVDSYLNKMLTPDQTNQVPGETHRFMPYLTSDGKIDFEVAVPITDRTTGTPIYKQVLVNAPLQLNPTVDFTQDIAITDRNQSRLIRTWAGNDVFRDTNANASASLNGGLGTDTSVYSGKAADYKLTHNADGTTSLKGSALMDQLTSIERLQFSDMTLAIDMNTTQSGGKAALLIGAVLGKSSLTDKVMVGNLLKFFDTGISLHDAADLLVKSGAIDGFAGGTGTDKFVNLIYHAVTGQTATTDITSGFASLIGEAYSKTDFLASVAEHQINQTNVGLVGLQQTGLEY